MLWDRDRGKARPLKKKFRFCLFETPLPPTLPIYIFRRDPWASKMSEIALVSRFQYVDVLLAACTRYEALIASEVPTASTWKEGRRSHTNNEKKLLETSLNRLK